MISPANILKNCENNPIDIVSITSGAAVDIPIILGNHVIDFNIHSTIELPEEATSISAIKNRVVITSSKLLQKTNALFIKGFINKSIYYYSNTLSNISNAHDNSKYCSVNVPFEYISTIKTNNLTKAYTANESSSKSKDYTQDLFHTKNEASSNLNSNLNKISQESFNNKPFCELIGNRIIEHCKYIYRENKNHPSKTLTPQGIVKLNNNMALRIEIQILQNQKVYIKPYNTVKSLSTLCSSDSILKDESTVEKGDKLNNICRDNKKFNNDYGHEFNPDKNFSSSHKELSSYRFLALVLGILISLNLKI